MRLLWIQPKRHNVQTASMGQAPTLFTQEHYAERTDYSRTADPPPRPSIAERLQRKSRATATDQAGSFGD